MDAARSAGHAAGLKFTEHEPMKLPSNPSLLLFSALLLPLLHAQDESAKVREIEQRVLRNQYLTGIDALVESAPGGKSANPEAIGKRLQWLTLVGTQIEGDNKTPAADAEQMKKSAAKLNELAWNMIISQIADKRHPEIALNLANIAIELVGENPDLKPDILDTKARALFLLGKHGEAISEQEKAIAATTVAEKKAGFEATLAAYKKDELPARNPEPAVALAGGAYIMGKLRTIVIPSIDFEDVTVEEAVDFLRLRATELDKAELDPARKGLNFVIQRPVAKPASAAGATPGDKLPATVADPGTIRIKELSLRNVPLSVALKYICDSARLRYKVDDYSVTLIHPDAPEDLFTRTFRVPLDFSAKLSAAGSGAKDMTIRPPIIELLRSAGIKFGEGSSATLSSSGMMLVTNTPSQLDKLENLITTLCPEIENNGK